MLNLKDLQKWKENKSQTFVYPTNKVSFNYIVTRYVEKDANGLCFISALIPTVLVKSCSLTIMVILSYLDQKYFPVKSVELLVRLLQRVCLTLDGVRNQSLCCLLGGAIATPPLMPKNVLKLEANTKLWHAHVQWFLSRKKQTNVKRNLKTQCVVY